LSRRPSGGRAGVVSIGAAVVLVAGFWIFVFPHTGFYNRYVVKAQLGWLLKDIAPPANTITLDIDSRSRNLDIPGASDLHMASGQYMTDQDFEAVKKHYLSEFPRHKFIFKGEGRKDRGDVDISFCRTGYQATLFWTNEPKVQGKRIYTIILTKYAGIGC
jgi:hypothetical protein